MNPRKKHIKQYFPSGFPANPSLDKQKGLNSHWEEDDGLFFFFPFSFFSPLANILTNFFPKMVKIHLPVPDNFLPLSYLWYFGLYSGTILGIESICLLSAQGARGSQQNVKCAMGKVREHRLG